MVDLSFNNSSWSSAGSCQASTLRGVRSIVAYSDSAHGDPLNWPVTSPPSASAYSRIPNIKLDVCDDPEAGSTITLSGYVKTAENVRIKGVKLSASTGETTVTNGSGY